MASTAKTTGTVLLWLLKLAARALELLVVALVLTGRWAVPRGWRLARRGCRYAHRRWVMRPVLLDREPAAVTAVVAPPVTLADLMQKQEANAR